MNAAGSPLRDSAGQPLVQRYDTALLDLDGVVYRGEEAVTGAVAALTAARAAGMRLSYVTNNASRPPEDVATHLRRLGLPAEPADVVTSAQAAARLLAEQLPSGAAVLVVGGEGLRRALIERGLAPVGSADDAPAAVVQGYAPDVDWRSLAEGAIAVARGLPWVATNTDLTIPTARGIAPGNGTLVAAVATATGRTPVVAGKPEAPLHREAVRRSNARHPLVVGDRLDTDIEGAVRAGTDSLLVLSGVTAPADLLAAAPGQRPTYLARGVGGLLAAHPAPGAVGEEFRCGAWRARVLDGELVLAGAAGAGSEDDGLDALRAACAAAWECSTTPGTRQALDVLQGLGLGVGSPGRSTG